MIVFQQLAQLGLGRARSGAPGGDLGNVEVRTQTYENFSSGSSSLVEVRFWNHGLCEGFCDLHPDDYYWLIAGAAADYDIQFDIVSGAPLGTFGVRLALSTSRKVSVLNSLHDSSKLAVVNVTIRDVLTSTVQATGTVTMEAHLAP